MTKRVVLSNRARQDLGKLPKRIRDWAAEVIGQLLAGEAPSGVQRVVRAEAPTFRVRKGDYRLIWEEAGQELRVLRIAHRSEAYRNL
jgi:mRNA-degrading endonuclease RelE of RelBE toxin-antitoxin system